MKPTKEYYTSVLKAFLQGWLAWGCGVLDVVDDGVDNIVAVA